MNTEKKIAKTVVDTIAIRGKMRMEGTNDPSLLAKVPAHQCDRFTVAVRLNMNDERLKSTLLSQGANDLRLRFPKQNLTLSA